MPEIPKIISVDDHVIEPADVWQDRLPEKYLDVGPRVEQAPLGEMNFIGGEVLLRSRATRAGRATGGSTRTRRSRRRACRAAVGFDRDEVKVTAHHLRGDAPGLLRPEGPPRGHGRQPRRGVAVLPDASRASAARRSWRRRTRSSPTSACKAYNDWMVDEWCGGSDGRLIPLPIIQLWDAELAAAEVRRNADRGGARRVLHRDPAVPRPAVDPRHRRYWDPFFEACAETDTVVCMHIGSSSKMPSTSADAPPAVGSTLTFVNAAMSLTDWLLSGVLERFPNLEARLLRGPDRLDPLHPRAGRRGVGAQPGVGRRAPTRCREPPSQYYHEHVYGCFFDDEHGLRVAREDRRRQRHLRDRLPALRLHVAAHEGDRRAS